MIVLDTNVVSEPMKPRGDAAVTAWLDRQVADTLYLTSTSLSELLVGIEALPPGRRRHGLAEALEDLLATLFGPRVLAFDRQAATAYAGVVTRARAAGHVISVGGGQLAAIARVQGFAVATRDTIPLAAAGITTINPWQA